MAIPKVTDSKERVTDPVLLSALAKQGIDKDYVEFFRDYAPRRLGKEHSPYAKLYRDLISGKRFMVVSGLPMVDADGGKIEAGWAKTGNKFLSKNNLFVATIDGLNVKLVVRNDQPNGKKAGDSLSYKPQLFLDGVEQSCDKPTLLPVDPVNPNYTKNTLEWDYGICKRRLRIIEGRILGSWLFNSKPDGEIRIKYNQIGEYRLRLGQFRVNEDEEVVKPKDFDELAQSQGYPIIISDSDTYYPDASPETSSVDGYCRQLYNAGSGVSWATIIADGGNGYADSFTYSYGAFFLADTVEDKWRYLVRGLFLYDTSGLPDNAIISSAVLSLYGMSEEDLEGWGVDVNIYSSAPASNTQLANGDFDSLGATAFSDTKDIDAWNLGAYNDFTLNANGVAAISKTGVSKFGTTSVTHDVGESAPAPWASGAQAYLSCYTSEQGEGFKPKLVITYSYAWEKSLSDSVTITDSIVKGVGLSKGDSVAIADSLAKTVGLKKSDTVAITDAIQKGVSIVKADSIAITDNISKGIGLKKTDTVGITDTVQKAIGLVKADTLTITDALSKAIGLIKADTVTIVDKFTRLLWHHRELQSFAGRALKSFTGRDLKDPSDLRKLH